MKNTKPIKQDGRKMDVQTDVYPLKCQNHENKIKTSELFHIKGY